MYFLLYVLFPYQISVFIKFYSAAKRGANLFCESEYPQFTSS